MSEGGPALTSDNCNTTGDDCLGSAGEGRDGVGRGIRRLIFGRDHIFDGGSASSGDSGPTNEGHDEAGNDGRISASRGRDVACGGWKSHVSKALSGKSTEQRGRPVERMVCCPLARRAGSAVLGRVRVR